MGQICLPPKIPRDSQPSIAPNSNVETSVSRASEHCGPHTIFVARESRKNPIAPLERKSRNSNPIGKKRSVPSERRKTRTTETSDRKQ